jgi:hypothetical protein
LSGNPLHAIPKEIELLDGVSESTITAKLHLFATGRAVAAGQDDAELDL